MISCVYLNNPHFTFSFLPSFPSLPSPHSPSPHYSPSLLHTCNAHSRPLPPTPSTSLSTCNTFSSPHPLHSAPLSSSPHPQLTILCSHSPYTSTNLPFTPYLVYSIYFPLIILSLSPSLFPSFSLLSTCPLFPLNSPQYISFPPSFVPLFSSLLPFSFIFLFFPPFCSILIPPSGTHSHPSPPPNKHPFPPFSPFPS